MDRCATPLQILHGYFSILDVSVCLNINLKLISQRLKVGCRESTVLLWRLQGGRQPGIIYSLSFSIVPWPRTVDALIRDSPPALIKADEDAKIQPSATCSNGGSNDPGKTQTQGLMLFGLWRTSLQHNGRPWKPQTVSVFLPVPFSSAKIVVIGNVSMYQICAAVADHVGFKYKETREACYMLLSLH